MLRRRKRVVPVAERADMTWLGLEGPFISNSDVGIVTVDAGLADAITDGQHFATHASVHFHGNVYQLPDGTYAEDVWRRDKYRETITAPTLPALMDAVNAKYEPH